MLKVRKLLPLLLLTTLVFLVTKTYLNARRPAHSAVVDHFQAHRSQYILLKNMLLEDANSETISLEREKKYEDLHKEIDCRRVERMPDSSGVAFLFDSFMVDGAGWQVFIVWLDEPPKVWQLVENIDTGPIHKGETRLSSLGDAWYIQVNFI